MKRLLKWLGLGALVLLLTLAGGVALVQHWIGTDDFRARVAHEASTALGVPVTLARLQVTLWPLPAVAVEDIAVQTRPALTLTRLEVRPAWRGLLQGRLELATVLVRGATLPQAGIEALLSSLQKQKQQTKVTPELQPEKASSLGYLPRRTVLEQLNWISARGDTITLEADAQLSEQGVPDAVSVKILKGQLAGASARLQRQGQDWTLLMAVGGGTVKGSFHFEAAPRPGQEFSLTGQLQTRAVEVAALSRIPQPVLSGRLEADTSFSARATSLAALDEALQTQSKFTVRNAVVHGIDLARAVRTVGLSRGGETALDALAGQVSTQGHAAQLSHLVASSGVLSASGNVAVNARRVLSGHVSVDLAASSLGSAVGVPLVVGGTLDAPEVTLTRGALIGAAIGTVVMPGVGTGAGASAGDRLGEGLKKLFGR